MKDEEVAYKIVRLYFEEVARLGFKRSLDLDQMISAYFYTLNKLKNKDSAVKAFEDRISMEGKKKHGSSQPSSSVVSSSTSNKQGAQDISDLI